MRQRIGIYSAAFLAWLTAYCGCLSAGWETAAVLVLLVAIPGAAAVARVEYRISEAQRAEPAEIRVSLREAEGEITLIIPACRDVEPESAVEVTEVLELPLLVEMEARAAVAQEQAVLEDIHDRYEAAAEEGMRVVEDMASEVEEHFDQAAWELGVA